MALRSRASGSQTIQKTSVAPGPASKPKRRPKTRLFVCVLVLMLLVVYVGIPVSIRASSWLQQALIYVHHIRTPLFGNISNPTEFGLRNARQFELLHTSDGCEIEAWQVLPKTYSRSSEHDYIAALSDGAPIILYLHGNTGTRATYHRVELYKYLAEERGYHVITFDYRGFGNSQCFPSETGMMEDGYLVWRWLRKHAANSRVYIWGHSLGSAAATYLTKELSLSQETPSGLVLDAPFTNIIDAATTHPIGLAFWPVQGIVRYLVYEAFEERFESVSRLEHITCPLLILHGRNDFIIPFEQGRKMYDTALESRKGKPELGEVSFVDCGNTTHKNNFVSPHVHRALDRFIRHQ